MVGAMTWSQLLAVCVICWLAVALAVGTMVGYSIAFGTSGDPG
jgi:DNA-binding transcriptional regulator of glucitol operon